MVTFAFAADTRTETRCDAKDSLTIEESEESEERGGKRCDPVSKGHGAFGQGLSKSLHHLSTVPRACCYPLAQARAQR